MNTGLNTERWRRIDDVLVAALAKETGAERDRFLDEACNGDTDLRREVEALLGAQAAATDWLERPVGSISQATFPESLVGQRLGPYKIRSELGQGGMSRVYLAARDDDAYHQSVAIKVIRPGLGGDSIARRFHVERQILASLDHPHIARLLDGGRTEEGSPYFVLEHIEGTPIHTYCERRNLSVPERLALLRTVCDAVGYAHGRLVVHCDLKPGNILVTEEGQVKLLDFGIAKLLDADSFAPGMEETLAEPRPFTPRYASPEQRSGGRITTATDVFALGLLARLIVTGGPGAWRSDGEDLPADLRAIVRLATRPDPDDRYRSVGELDEDLRRYLEDLPVRARSGGLAYRARRFVRRHPLELAATAIFVGVIVLFTLGLVGQVRRTEAALASVKIERDKAEQVAGLLRSLFESNDPWEQQEEEVTVRTILDRGHREISRLDDQPLVQASALLTLGDVYMALAQYEAAQPALERSLDIRRSRLPADHPDVLQSARSLADLHALLGDYGVAEPLRREVVEFSRQPDGDPLQLATDLDDLGVVLRDAGRFEDAEKAHQEALAIRRDLGEGASPAALAGLASLAETALVRNEWKKAARLFRRALDGYQRLSEANPKNLALLKTSLATSLTRAGELEEAVEIFGEALAIRAEALGPRHPEVAMTEHNMAAALGQLGRYEEALALFESALATRLEAFGEKHPFVAANLSAMAGLHERRGDLEQAVATNRRSLALAKELVSPRHPAVAIILARLGRLQLKLGEPAAAEPLLRESLEIRRAGLPEGSHLTGESLLLLAEAHLALGRLEVALEGVREAEKIFVSSEDAEPENLARARELLEQLRPVSGT